MKTLSAHNATATDSPHVDVIRLATIAFSGLTLYLTDRTWGSGADRNVFNGQIYEPLVISWDTIEMGAIDPITYETADSRASFVIDNSVPMGGANSFTRLFTSHDPHFATVTISEIFAGATVADDKIDIFKGQIEDILDMAPDRVTITATGYEQAVNNKFPHIIVDTTTYPDADPDDVGKMLPIVYGSAKKAPFRSIASGPVTTLSEDITATDATLKLSDASLFSTTGTILVDSEQITYTGKTGDSLTGCTRAANGTTAVSHNRGAMLGEIKTEYVYALGHAVKAIHDVYVNGVKQEATEYTAYTGQTGDEHASYPGLAIISFPSWPQIKRDVDLEANSSSGYAIERHATNCPIGHVKAMGAPNSYALYGEAVNYDTRTDITFPTAPAGSLSGIYIEYDFYIDDFGATSSGTSVPDYEFYIDGVLVAQVVSGSLVEYVDSPLRVNKGAWATSTHKTASVMYRKPTGDTGVMSLTINSAVQYCTSTVSEEDQWGKQYTAEATNLPVGAVTDAKTIDTSREITFPAAPSGNLHEVKITYTLSVKYGFTSSNLPKVGVNPFTVGDTTIRQVYVSDDGVLRSYPLLPGSSSPTLYYDSWQTSVSKTPSVMAGYGSFLSYLVTGATQTCYTDDFTDDVVISGNSMADSVIGGLVSADVDGYQDDGSGTYTGTPAALIERPDHIFKHVLVDRCGLTASEIDATAYTAAGTLYAAGSYALGFVIEEKPSIPALLNRIAYQSKSIQFWEGGVHHVVCIPASDPADITLDQYRIDLNQIWPSYTDRAAILNTLSATYHRDWSGYEDDVTADRAIVTSASSGSVTKYGTLKEETSLPYITTSGHAQAVIDWIRGDLATPRLVVQFVGGYYLTQIERGDIIVFYCEEGDYLHKAMLGLIQADIWGYTVDEWGTATDIWGNSVADRFRVLGMTRRPDGAIQITAVQVH